VNIGCDTKFLKCLYLEFMAIQCPRLPAQIILPLKLSYEKFQTLKQRLLFQNQGQRELTKELIETRFNMDKLNDLKTKKIVSFNF